MTKTNTSFTYLFIALLALLIGGCGGGGGSSGGEPTASNTYSTTSTKGDYAEWTLTGSALAATWQIVDDTGLIDQTLTIAATCGSPDADGLRSCTIDTASCVPGESACSDVPTTGDTFDLMDAPGVALFAITDEGTVDQQLHVGFKKDAGACADDLTGDYSFVHIGLSGTDNFGLYRSDANFVNIRHVDFGFETPDMNTISQTVAYRTGTEQTILTNDGCTEGVRRRSSGGENFRLMMTASGLFVLDFPSGQGGIISFNVDNAATLADFAGKSFGGIAFPDNGPPAPVSGVFGSVIGSQINFTATGAGAASIMDLGAVDSMTNPTYPDFTVAPPLYTDPPSVLAATYPTPDDIPGLFKLDGLTDDGRIVMAAMKFGSKVVAIGVVYNYRTTTDIDPNVDGGATFFGADGLYNTGEFILFER